MVCRANEEEAKAKASQVKKRKMERIAGKSVNFLARQEEEIAPIVLEMLLTGTLGKLATTEEEMKKARDGAEAMRGQQTEDAAKLAFALAEIEALKKEIHETNCEVAALTKKIETSDAH